MADSPGYLELLRANRDFRYLFSARTVSLAGDWLSMLAVIAMLREVHGTDAAALSGFFILKLLPIFLIGPFAGVVADRFSRRGIMVLSDVVRVLFVLLLLATPFVEHPIPFVYGLVLLQVLASAFFEPARSAALPQLVPASGLATANALGALMWSTMFALGAAIGGAITEFAGWRVALIVDAATYLVSALLILRIRLPARERPPREPGWRNWTGWQDFSDGIRFVLGRLDVATALFVKLGWGLAGAVTLFLTLFGERVYSIAGRPDLSVSLLFTARAIGTGVGPWFARKFLPSETPRAMRRLLTGSFVWAALWYIAFSWAPSIGVALACVTLAHLGGSVLWVYSTVLIQRMVPDRLLGRVSSADLGFATLSISFSTWIFGWLIAAEVADLRVLVRTMGGAILIPGLIWYLCARRWPVGKKVERS